MVDGSRGNRQLRRIRRPTKNRHTSGPNASSISKSSKGAENTELLVVSNVEVVTGLDEKQARSSASDYARQRPKQRAVLIGLGGRENEIV